MPVQVGWWETEIVPGLELLDSLRKMLCHYLRIRSKGGIKDLKRVKML
jgi:hypothetical protein